MHVIVTHKQIARCCLVKDNLCAAIGRAKPKKLGLMVDRGLKCVVLLLKKLDAINTPDKETRAAK